jgi:methionine biosynthesis protein MetW
MLDSSRDKVSRRLLSHRKIETEYNDKIWRNKMSSSEYQTLEKRWRSRWDFAQMHVPCGSKVLDVGCGDGVLGEFLTKEKSCEVYGLDISSLALDLSKTKGVVTYLCDVSHDPFPFGDKTFDVVIMTCILEHIPFPEHTLEESKRVLKYGGLMIVTIPNATHIRNRLELLMGRMPSELLHMDAGIHFRFWNYRDEFEKYILANTDGLNVIEKVATLKNPRASSRLKRDLLNCLIKAFPNLFGEYTHFLIKRTR